METQHTPSPELLIRAFRAILGVTRRRGLFTLARLNAKLFSDGQIVALTGGARMFVPSDPHFFCFVLGTHENHIAEILVRHVRPGDVCFDVGANIGYFSAMLANLVGPAGEVFAFEPVPENYSVLEKNAAMAATQGLRIHTRKAAVSAEHGELRIVRKQWSTYHEVAPITSEQPDAERIPAIPIDEVISGLSGRAVSMLKIDVEGHELPVVQGLKGSLEAGRVHRMVIEITPGFEARAIQELIRPHARQMQSWVKQKWVEQSLTELSSRTDVFVEFSVR
jgi:FkbM family methyltransferase